MKNLTLLTFCFIALLVFTKCSSGKDETEKEEKVNFTVTSPFVRDTIVTREYVSQIKSINHIELRALEKGYLQKIYVDEGQFVKKGQLMFQIMPMIYQAERQKAQAEVDFVNIEYENKNTGGRKNRFKK
jgi:membrane fusion protein (multidrug efflux system)